MNGSLAVTLGTLRTAVLCACALIVSTTAVEAQSFEWVRQSGGALSDQARAIGVDTDGNAYVVGYFDGTAAFGLAQENTTTLTSLNATRDLFLAKYDTTGTLQWARAIGSTDGGGGQDDAFGIAVDAAGHSYVTGLLGAGVTDFGPGVTLAEPGPFVARFDADGHAVWATNLTVNGSGRALAVAVDPAGQVFLAGGAPEPLLGGAIPTVWHVSPSGTLVWVRQAPGNGLGSGLGLGVTATGADVYVTGRFGGTLTFGAGEPGAATVDDEGRGSSLVFVARYHEAGHLVWARQSTISAGTVFAGSYPGGIAAVQLDNPDNETVICVAGSFGGEVVFGAGEPNETIINGGNGIFLARFDDAGALLWARPGLGTAEAYAVAVDAYGHPQLTGTVLAPNLTLAPGQTSQIVLPGGGHAFVAKYDPSGGLLWGVPAGDQFGAPAVDGGAGIAVDRLRNVYVAGFFAVTATFGVGQTNETTLASAGGLDMFVAKYAGAVATATMLTASPNPAIFGATVTLTAEVLAAGGVPGGTVTFYAGDLMLGFAPLVAGVATLPVSRLGAGEHSLTARYGGNSAFAPSNSETLIVSITREPTTTALVTSHGILEYGQTLTLTAVVTAASGDPLGIVEFFDGLTSIGAAPLSGSVAELQLADLEVGAHSLTARYAGDGGYAPSVSPAHDVTIMSASTTTTLDVSATTIVFGEAVILTATVLSAAAVPTGHVDFFDGGLSLGAATLVGGAAQMAVPALAAGVHSLSAAYAGGESHATSASSAVVVTVGPATSSMVLAAAPTTVAPGGAVTLTASVGSSAGQPTGSVEFFDGSASIGSATIAGNSAVLVVTTLSPGSHLISANYLGAGSFSPSLSNTVTVTVTDAAPLTPGVYWTGADGSLNRLDPRTGVSTAIVPAGGQSAHAIVADRQAGWIYWRSDTLAGINQINRVRGDGSAIESVITGLRDSPTDLAIDPETETLYWREPGLLKRARADDGRIQTVTTSLDVCPNALNGPDGGLVFDPGSRQLYFGWSDGSGICRTDANGADPVAVVSAAYSVLPQGLALDSVDGRPYFTGPPSTFGGPIQIRRGRANGEAELVYEAPSVSAMRGDLAIDVASRKMYWPEATFQGNVIKRANLDGSGVEIVARLAVEAIGIEVVSGGDDIPPAPLDRGFIDFETRADGTMWPEPNLPYEADAYRPLGVSMISESPLAIRRDTPSFNTTAVSKYRLIAGPGEYSYDDTWVDFLFHDGTREIAFDSLNSSGLITMTAFDSDGQLVSQQLQGVVAGSGVYIDERGRSLAGVPRLYRYSTTVHRVRIRAVPLADWGLLPLAVLHIDNLRYEEAIPETTSIDRSAELAPGVSVGDQVTVARGVSVGARSVLSDFSVVDRDSTLGTDVFLGVGALVARNVTIGSRTHVGDATRIEQEGWIGADVWIGPNSVVERNVRIGNVARIGDRTTIGASAVIGAGVTIGSGTTIEAAAVIGPGAVIGNQVTIRRNVVVPAGASIPDGATVR